MREAAELGMAAIYCSEDVGGAALRRLDGVRIFEQLATADPTVAAFMSIHNMCTWMVDTYGTPEQRKSLGAATGLDGADRELLPHRTGAGSDAAALRTKAVRDGDYYVLDGVKQFISGAGASDVYVVMARTGGPGPRGISAFVVDKDTPGVSFGANEDKMGWNAQPTAQVVLEGARVPVDAMLGGADGEGTGFGRDERTQRRAHQHRGLLAGRRAGRLRQERGVPRRPRGVRHPADRRAHHPVHPRRHGDGTGDIAKSVVAGCRLRWMPTIRTRSSCARWRSAT